MVEHLTANDGGGAVWADQKATEQNNRANNRATFSLTGIGFS